jgi:hypothetical protein
MVPCYLRPATLYISACLGTKQRRDFQPPANRSSLPAEGPFAANAGLVLPLVTLSASAVAYALPALYSALSLMS